MRGADGREPGRVAVLDLLRARTRRFEVVFVLGLEEGSLPRRTPASPFLDDDARRELAARAARASRTRSRATATSSTPRARARRGGSYLVREAATDDGSPREPSPFWDEVARLFDAGRRRAARRAAPALGAHVAARAARRPSASGCARSPRSPRDDADDADALALANGWERRLERALQRVRAADARSRHPLVLEQLGERTSFNVTELERFADCSSAWFVERLLDPQTIDAEVDAKLRGSVAHTALHQFFGGLPKELGVERVDESQLDRALPFLRTLPRHGACRACAWS